MALERLRMPATMESYDELRRFVLAQAPTAVHQKVDLVLEELLLNVIHYAYRPEAGETPERGVDPDCPPRPVQRDNGPVPSLEVEYDIRCYVTSENPGRYEEFVLRIRDWGRPFDPVQRARPDTSCSMEKRTLGGLGILLVRNMADSVSYRREYGQNVLDVRFVVHD